MRKKTQIWLRGLAAGAIAGAAQGTTASFGAGIIDPQTFNLEQGLAQVVKLFILTAVVGGFGGAMAFLKQSPIPPPDTIDIVPTKDVVAEANKEDPT